MVVYKCRELGNPVTETLAAYVAQTMFNTGKLITQLLTSPTLQQPGGFILKIK
jgi:hypothetical protein